FTFTEPNSDVCALFKFNNATTRNGALCVMKYYGLPCKVSILQNRSLVSRDSWLAIRGKSQLRTSWFTRDVGISGFRRTKGFLVSFHLLEEWRPSSLHRLLIKIVA